MNDYDESISWFIRHQIQNGSIADLVSDTGDYEMDEPVFPAQLYEREPYPS